MQRIPRAIPLFAALALCLLVLGGRAQISEAGTVYQVDMTDDDPSKTACTAAANDCSLRGAITKTNNTAGHQTVSLGNGELYTIEQNAIGENDNQQADYDIKEDITILGNDSIIDADEIERIFDVFPSGTGIATIENLTVRNGLLDGFPARGAGIRVQTGTLNLIDVTVQNNTATAPGGGITVANDANVHIEDSTITGNESTPEDLNVRSGGGLYMEEDATGTLEIINSTVSSNHARSGGGVYVQDASQVTIEDSTFSNNIAETDCPPAGLCVGGGGGLASYVPTTITGSLFTQNSATEASGGGILASNVLTISGTVVDDNQAQGLGGGIYGPSIDADDVVVTNNTSMFGAGIYALYGTINRAFIEGNVSTRNGGGIFTLAELEVTSSTITGNSAALEGGGMAIGNGTTVLLNTTISGNTAATGGGIARTGTVNTLSVGMVSPQGAILPGTASINHTTIAFNTSVGGGSNIDTDGVPGDIEIGSSIVAGGIGGDNCNQGLTTQNYNVEDDDTCGFNDTDDQPNANADLQPLAENGGGSPTHALGPASAAIDLVTGGCPPPAVDQRGFARPIGAACDAGAFESPLGTTPTATPSVTPTSTASAAPSPTGSPTATPTPTGTGAAEELIWGDWNCTKSVDPVDSLLALRHDAGLDTNTGACPEMGEVVDVENASPHPWGDADCSGDVNPIDSLKILRHDAGLSVTQEDDCPEIGSEVIVS